MKTVLSKIGQIYLGKCAVSGLLRFCRKDEIDEKSYWTWTLLQIEIDSKLNFKYQIKTLFSKPPRV